MGSLKKFFSVDDVDVNVKDGRIDQVEVLAALNKCSIEEARAAYERYVSAPKVGSDQVEEMLKTFARFDKDGSGFIEANEMGSLKKFFSVDDVDVNVKDGRIDQIELLAALNRCSIEDAHEAFERYHYKQSRKLGREQVEEMLKTFARFDKDGSGFIEANEMG